MGKVIYLFTDKFPYKGGEPFLETEIHYLSKAFEKVIIFPLTGHGTEKLTIPSNVEVIDFETNRPVYLKKLLLKHGWIVIKWFVLEFIKSPHRFKYITQFNWNFKRLVGLLNNAIELKNFINHLNLSKPHQPLYYSYWFNDWASMLAMAKQMGMRGKLVCRTHGFDFDEQQQGRGYHPFRSVELPLFEKVYQVSEYGQAYISERFPKAKNLEVSKLGVTEKGINLISEDTLFQIVSCSNFVPLKRVNLIAEILSNLNISFHWTHFGAGKGMEEVQQKAKHVLKEGSYQFKGFVPNKELMDWYKLNPVDLFVNVSNLEGLPVSLMEAICFGIPVVGCNICGVPEIVNEKTGILLEENFDVKEVAKSIEGFLKSKSRDKDYRNGVKAFWKGNFDGDKNYLEFSKSLKVI
jgi:colanic acid/amylovoran biosynthesis glycosyltransferase